jgi:CheY-like chemotaxis protein
MEENNATERVLVVAPVGRDAPMMAELLGQHGFEAHICASVAECAEQIESGAAALLFT